MRKSFSGILAAVALLLTGWNAEAMPLVGNTGVQSGTISSVEKAGCKDPTDKTDCEEGKFVSCKFKGEDGDQAAGLRCECASCQTLAPVDPANPLACPCPAKRCCNSGTGRWCCSP